MAEAGVQQDQKTSCLICLDLLKDPTTIPCGHSYCMSCITARWDRGDTWGFYICPQCRKSFTPRPVLEKNSALDVFVEELRKTRFKAAPAGPEDVACDVCPVRKRKACKSCTQCVVSYCEEHIQLHYESPALKKHKLVEPSKKLQENVCAQHNEVMKMFCRTDQQSICFRCSEDEHKNHNTISAVAERTERQRWLNLSRQRIQQGIQDREKEVRLFEKEIKAINVSADEAVEHSERMFTELIRLMEKRYSDVKQQVRARQKANVKLLLKPQEKLEQEILELRRKDAELQKLSHMEDDNQFLQEYPSLSELRVSPHTPSSSRTPPDGFFEDVKAAVRDDRNKLHVVLKDKWTNISQQMSEVSVVLLQLQPQPEPPQPEPQLLLTNPEPEQLLITKPEPGQLPIKPEPQLLLPPPEPEPELLLTKPEPEQLLIIKPEPEQLLQIKPEPQQLLIKQEPEQLLLINPEPDQLPLSKPEPNPPSSYQNTYFIQNQNQDWS